jgi:PPOX class probable F420-dependent enzyme
VTSPDSVLSRSERAFLADARRSVLATITTDGAARLVPICHVLDPERPILYTPLDDKPKEVADPYVLARVRDILREPRVSVLVEHWDEDWAYLAWLRCHGLASLLDPHGETALEQRTAVASLRLKYPQYATHRLETRPVIRIDIERATSWGPLDPV